MIAQQTDLHAIVSHSAGAYLTMMALLDFPADKALGKCVYIAPYPSMEMTLEIFTSYFRLPTNIHPACRQWMSEIGGEPIELQSLESCLSRHRTPQRPDCLFIHDAQDKHIPLAYTQDVLSRLAHGELHTTEGLGHFKVLKDRKVVDKIVAFLN